MAFNRQGTGLVILRVCLGVFFIAQATTKLRWMTNASILRSQLSMWLEHVAPGSISYAYLQRFAIPFVWVLARLVPLGEFVCGVTLVAGYFASTFAFIAFLIVLNYQVASGAIFEWGFLANRAGLPVLAATLGLALAGTRLPWSLRS
jgi:uncharacterized membrane protein YphA (DoxX/SURF4 family)